MNIRGSDAAMTIAKVSDNTIHASAGGLSSIVLATDNNSWNSNRITAHP